jgi:hypothetical protein
VFFLLSLYLSSSLLLVLCYTYILARVDIVQLFCFAVWKNKTDTKKISQSARDQPKRDPTRPDKQTQHTRNRMNITTPPHPQPCQQNPQPGQQAKSPHPQQQTS